MIAAANRRVDLVRLLIARGGAEDEEVRLDNSFLKSLIAYCLSPDTIIRRMFELLSVMPTKEMTLSTYC